MSKPNYDLRVSIPEGSAAWEVLQQEIPKGAELREAFLVLTPKRASVSLYYRGVRPDGEPHKRISTHSVTLDPTEEGSGQFVRQAFGKGKYAQTFLRLLPESSGG